MSQILVPLTLLQEIHDLTAKRTSLISHLHDLETLVLGSSHGDFGFNPEYVPNSFNLCCPSQDLRHSQLLYEKCHSMNPNIKNIILFYSVFSSGHLLEKTSEKEKCAAYKELFTLDAEYDDDEINQSYQLIAGRLLSIRLEAGTRGFLRTDAGPFFCDTTDVETRANSHLKHFARKNELLRLIQLILTVQSRGQNLYIAMAPVRRDYRAAVERLQPNPFQDLHAIAKFPFQRPLQIMNFYDDFSFQDEHFGDFDHLLPQGAGSALLSNRIHNYLRAAQPTPTSPGR